DCKQHAVCTAPEQQRDHETIRHIDPQAAEAVLLETCAIELFAEALGGPHAHRLASDGSREGEASAEQPLGYLAGARCHDQLLAACELDQQCACGDDRAPALGHELEDQAEICLA